MSGPILVSRDESIATVTLNRPEKLNALTLEMWQRLGAAIQEVSADEALRCVVLRGAGGKAFAAGADIAEFETVRANAAQAKSYGRSIAAAMRAVADCRHPTIALIEGVCVGGGLEIASQCDLRICGASSRFGVPIKDLGLVVAYDELAGLMAVAGHAVALEILLEGRIFGADEALAKGLVTRVVADGSVEAEAHAAAKRIAEGAPLVARWHKKFARRLSDNTPLSETEYDESYACFDTEDFRTGMRAFLSKKRPTFNAR